MTIEFHCSQCNQLLRVPETAIGKQARCPECQALMVVPAGAVATPPQVGAGEFGGGLPLVPPTPPPAHPFGEAAGGHPFSEQAGSANPYASPPAVMQGYQP